MKKLIALTALALMSWTASALEHPAWTCGMEFTGKSKGIKIIIGSFRTVARGTMNCKDAKGNHFSQAIKITMGTSFLSPSIGIGAFKFKGAAGEISLFNCGPATVLGDYVVLQGQGAIIGGIGAFTAAKVNAPELSLMISMQLLHGIGFDVGIQDMRIEALPN